MRLNSFFYSFRQGVANIWHNKLFSLASIATMTACIFLFGVFYSIGINFSSMVKQAESGVSVTVYFVDNITQVEIEDIAFQIKNRPEVESYKYVSAEEAWEYYKSVWFEGREDLAEGFADNNPLANSANFEIYLNDVSQQDDLVRFLESVNGVRQVNKSEEAARVLTDFNNMLTFIFIGIIVILIAVAVFLISNTISVGISVRSEEISIMRLIGAKDSFVRAPFIIEGVIIGLVGAIIPLIILYFLYGGINGYVMDKFQALTNIFETTPREIVFKTLVPVAVVLSVGIGFVGSRMTVKRHLKV